MKITLLLFVIFCFSIVSQASKLNFETCQNIKTEFYKVFNVYGEYSVKERTAAIANFEDCNIWMQQDYFSLMTHFGNQQILSVVQNLNGVSVVSLETLKNIYQLMRQNPFYPYEIIETQSCFDRANVMGLILKSRGVSVGQVIAGEGDFNVFGEVSKKNVHWDTHTSIFVWVRLQGKNIRYVIDPSLTSEPLTLQQWTDKMTLTSTSKKFKLEFIKQPINQMQQGKKDKYPPGQYSVRTMMRDYIHLLVNSNPLPERINPEVLGAASQLIFFYRGKTIPELMAPR